MKLHPRVTTAELSDAEWTVLEQLQSMLEVHLTYDIGMCCLIITIVQFMLLGSQTHN